MAKARGSRKRPWGQTHRELDPERIGSIAHTETGPDGRAYQVRHLRSSTKEYMCPGCLQIIPVGRANVVAWPEEPDFGEGQGTQSRRHWHPECWRRGLRPN